MFLYDFTSYIVDDTKLKREKGNRNGLQEDIDVFRHQYPVHVQKIAACFRIIEVCPENWKSIIRQYKIAKKVFLQIGNFQKFSIVNKTLKNKHND